VVNSNITMTSNKIDSLNISDLVIDQTYEINFCDTETSDIIDDEIAPEYNGNYKLKQVIETTIDYTTLEFKTPNKENTDQITYAIFENIMNSKYIFIAKPFVPVKDKDNFYFKTVTFVHWNTIDDDVSALLADAMNPMKSRWNETHGKFERYTVSQDEYVFSQITDEENYTGCVIFPYNNQIISKTYENCIICYAPLDNVHGPGFSNNCKKNFNNVIQVCDLESPKHYLHRGCAIAICNMSSVNEKRGKCPYCVNRNMINNIANVKKINTKDLQK
jgi:hypothetical protein